MNKTRLLMCLTALIVLLISAAEAHEGDVHDAAEPDVNHPASSATAIGLTFVGMTWCMIAAGLPVLIAMCNRLTSQPFAVSPAFMAGSFGFAGGALLFGALFNILPESVEHFHHLDGSSSHWEKYGTLAAWGSALLGAFFYMCLERFLSWLAPDVECACHGPKTSTAVCVDQPAALSLVSIHLDNKDAEAMTTGDAKCCDNPNCGCADRARLNKMSRVSWTMFVVMTLHHIPEGLASYIIATTNLKSGVVVGIILLLHVGPEGLALGIPAFVAYPHQPWRPFLHGAISGLGFPIGALIAFGSFKTSKPDDTTLAVISGAVGGMLVTIALKGMLPYGHSIDPTNKVVGYSAMAGASIILLSLACFDLAGFDHTH